MTRYVGALVHTPTNVAVQVYDNGHQRIAVFQGGDAPELRWPTRTPLTQIAATLGPKFMIASPWDQVSP